MIAAVMFTSPPGAHMLRRRIAATAALAVAGALAATAPALAGQQGPPPLPTAASGATVERVASGVAVPTSFAFAGDTVFAGGGPAEEGNPPTGLFTLANGRATKVPGTPRFVFGLAWFNDRLYVSAGDRIISYRDWNGTRFGSSRVIRRTNRQLKSFNGLAFGPDGLLYTGVGLDPRYDGSRRDPARYARTVVSMRPSGRGIKIVARGLRQPFQMTFPEGATSPYVTDLAQETPRRRVPLDQIVVARQGDSFGFPTCVRFVPTDCAAHDKPLVNLPRHSSPMGIGSFGQTLYVALFGGLEPEKPSVVTIPVAGGDPTPFLTGFVAPIVGLGINGNQLYVGDLTGSIYRVAVG
jgi:glucose/arabinose dehydrogenase